MARRFDSLSESVDDLDAAYQKWIYKQLESRVGEYSHVDKVTILCASWNVNAKTPTDADNLKDWLLPENTAAPDIYAIGLQEIVDLNVTNILMKSSTTVETTAFWVQKFSKTLNQVDYYKVLLDKSLVGIMFVIFVKASLHSCIKDVKYALTYTGSSGYTGNKGGISISMKIHDSPLCFVCAHFHANREAVAARNLDYQLITENADFVSVGPEYSQDPDTLFLFPHASDSAQPGSRPDSQQSSAGNSGTNSPLRPRLGSAGTGAATATMGVSNSIASAGNGNGTSGSTTTMNPAFSNRGAERKGSITNPIMAANNRNNSNSGDATAPSSGPSLTSTPGKVRGAMKVLEHEYVFWMGDLNYRLEDDVEIVTIFERLYNETWETLRASDQLQLERAKQNVFHGFKEGLLSFPPTYKYQPGTDLYETRADKKLRAPAWCDRVLWKSTRVDRDVTMLHYRSAPLHMSDHKPISAMFICNTRKIVKEKLKEVYADLLLTVDKWINESKPKIDVANRLIDFGPIVHNKMYRAVMQLRNTGTVMAEWGFVPKNDQVEVSKSWLKFAPIDGILAPEETCEVEVLVILNLEEAYEIATMKANLVDDIVILRVHNGNDLFCIVNACLTADTCATVCSAYARAGNRNSLQTSSAQIALANQSELRTEIGTLKISHSSPVPRDS